MQINLLRKYIIRIMFGLKIAYNGKNIMLGKGMDSLKTIQNQLNNRFPGQFPHGAILKYQGNVISQYEQIQAIANTSANKTLKLQAQPAPPKILSAISQQKISQSVSDTKDNISQTQQNQQKVKEPQVKQQVAKVEQVENKEQKIDIEIQHVPQNVVEFDINIDSSQEQQKKDQQIQEKQIEQVQKVQEIQQFKPEIVKCAIYGQAPKIQQPQIIKCQIFGKQITKIKQIQSHLLNQNQQQIVKESKNKNVSNLSSNLSEVIGDYVEDHVEFQLKQVQPGVYECIFCKEFQICNVCDTKRKLYQNSKFIKLVNHIVDKKLNQKITQLENRLLQKLAINKNFEKIQKKQQISQKKQVKQIKQKSVKRQLPYQKEKVLSNSFEIDQLKAVKEINFGEQFNWTFSIKPRKSFQNEQKLYIIDQKTGQLQSIAIKNDTQALVGPFFPEKQGRFEKTYRLCIKQQDQSLQLFGPKFGFSVMITKPKNLKVLSNGYRQEIDKIRKGYKCEKSTEYLIEKLKQLGINEENYEENKGLIPDIIQTV